MQWSEAGVFINLAAIVFAAGGLAYSVHSLGKRMVGIETEMKQIVAVLVTQGRHEERMNSMDQRVLAQGRRLDEFMKAHADALSNMARMVENTVSRVNNLADRGMKNDGGSRD